MTPAPLALLVEDTDIYRLILSAYLRQLGFEVTALESGESAAEVARELKPDLICLDLMLPGVGGYEVCAELRAAPETADTPILITSARATPQDRAFAELAGADDYLTKPFLPTELAESVRRLLRRKRAQA